MGVILLILQLIGALPGVINFLRILWDYIQQIRNPVEKKAAKAKFKQLVFRRQHIRKMTAKENEDLLEEAQALYHEVQNILNMEG